MVKTKNGVEVAKFSRSPRPNFLIEIFRFIALLGLVMIHIQSFGGPGKLEGFVRITNLFYSKTIDIFPFIVVTGIFTIGKGRDYFLRNLSRFIFVLILVLIVAMPIFYSKDNSLTFSELFIGGRNAWYLWQILILAMIFPFLKIDKFLKKSKVINIIIAISLVLPFSFLSDGLITSGIMLFCTGLSGYIVKFTLQQWNVKLSTKLWIFGFITLILLVAGGYVGIHYHEKWVSRYTNISLIAFMTLIPIATPKWFSWLIHNSYFVYEFHFAFLIAAKHIFYATGKVSFDNEMDVWMFFLLALTLSMVGSFIVSQLQSKIWEPIFGNKFLYKVMPMTMLYWIVFGIYIICYIVYSALGYAGIL